MRAPRDPGSPAHKTCGTGARQDHQAAVGDAAVSGPATVLLCLVLGWPAPVAAATPRLGAGDLPGWRVAQKKVYAKGQLFGYINGGAELYREYGFVELTVLMLSRGKAQLKVELYRMASPAAALGVYSVSRGRCGARLKGAAWSCVSQRRVSFCRAGYLVNVVPMDAEAQAWSSKAARALLNKIKGQDFSPPELFQRGAVAGGRTTLRYLRGPLAVAAAVPDWEARLKGLRRFELYLSKTGRGATAVYAAELRPRSSRGARALLKSCGLGQLHKGQGWRRSRHGATWLAARMRSQHRVQLLESSSRAALEAVLRGLK